MRNRAAFRSPDQSTLLSVGRGFAALQRAGTALEQARRAGAAAAEAIGKEVRAELRCDARLLPAAQSDLAEDCCYLILVHGTTGERALLEIEEGFAAALVDRLAGGAGEPSLAGAFGEAERAALGFLALTGLRAIRDFPLLEDALATRLISVAGGAGDALTAGGPREGLVAVDLDLRLGELAGQGRLLVPTRSALHLCALAGPTPGPIPPQIASARLRGTLVAVGCDLLPGELDRMAPGDAALLGELTRLPDGAGLGGPARLELEGLHLLGRLEGRCFTVASLEQSLAPEVAMESPASGLPVHVEVQLARVRLPLGEFAALRPGFVLSLDMTLEDPVLLRVGDRPFARAELVDVEGELGARIIQLLD